MTLSVLFDPAVLPNPYPVYAQLRAEDPVHWDDFFQLWALTRYADIAALLRDPRISSKRITNDGRQLWDAERLPGDARPAARATYRAFAHLVLMYDPPEHTRFRSMISRAFTPRMIEGMRPFIQSTVDELIDAVEAQGRMDLIADLAYPLPAIVIAEMLGVPHDDHEQFKAWSADFATSFDVDPSRPEREAQAVKGVAALLDYVAELVERRRTERHDDLVQAHVDLCGGDEESVFEVVANLAGLLFAGHETTTNLLGNGLFALLRHPEQWQRLRDEPELLGSAVEECLRYDAPVQWIARRAAQDLEIGGKAIRQGQLLGLFVGAANRDPAQFAEPDRFDVGRRENRHLSFAHGIHFCLGAALARLEGQIAIGTLARRLPHLRLAGEATWRENVSIRGLQSLPVSFAPAL